MADNRRFVVVGDGLAGRLAALRLARTNDVVLLSDPRARHGTSPQDERLVGKPAHSHVFLPRMLLELEKTAPEVLIALQRRGLSFGPGAKGLRPDLAPGAKRLFAMRWQVDQALNDCMDEHFDGEIVPFTVRDTETAATTAGAAITALLPAGDGAPFEIAPEDIVIDATGAQRNMMDGLIGDTGLLIRHHSHMSYLSQFFRLNDDVVLDELPEPLFSCSVNYGQVYITLYPGGDGWFSLTVAHDMRNAETRAQTRTTVDVLAYVQESEELAAWVNQATPIGRPTTYLDPRNSWAARLFAKRRAPTNYFAVGDSLVTTNPALGAGCSFAATHVRVLVDVLDQDIPNPLDRMQAFGQNIAEEQYWFFRGAVQTQPPDAPRQAPQSRGLVGRPRRMMFSLIKGSSLRDSS